MKFMVQMKLWTINTSKSTIKWGYKWTAKPSARQVEHQLEWVEFTE